MLRFILNFLIFGILFYLIYISFPETFYTLVSWADKFTQFVKEIYTHLAERFQDWMHRSSS
jgi:hypothetical protein